MITFDQLGASGKAKLLDMAFMPFITGFSSIPFCAFALSVWAYELHKNFLGFVIWGGVYVTAAIGIRLLNQHYTRARLITDPDKLSRKWVPIICYVALAHAFGLTIPLFLIIGRFPFEFTLLYYAIVAAVLATYATHLTPLLKVFQCLFYPCWGAFILLSPWAFPVHWHFMLLLLLVFASSIHKHSQRGHQFFLKQILLEENETRLAADYRHAKVQAEAALQAKNQFLTTASHDLRQPIHAMVFLIEAIGTRNKDHLLTPVLNDLKQSVRSLTHMFNALLDLSKIELGQITPHPSNVSLDMLLQEITTIFNEEARAKNLEIRTHLSAGKAMVNVDRTLLHQSIMNLMHNAIRYTKQGGILLAIRKRGDDWQIDVWDTGTGITPADSAHIFSPFYRNEHAWRIDSAGHGLGLAVVARCCEIMNCQYGFSSRLHRGSHFWLRLPANLIKPNPVEKIDSQASANFQISADSLSGKCLIIDDDPQVITAWKSMLSSWGLELQSAESGTEAFTIVNNGFIPQVIFCDQRLRAGESGFDILRALLDRCKEASGVMISGEFDSPELKEAEAEGYLVLRKPLEPEVLFALLSRWLKNLNN
jgi:signal transduction histidine kinase/CheY-like chemotaxis protein